MDFAPPGCKRRYAGRIGGFSLSLVQLAVAALVGSFVGFGWQGVAFVLTAFAAAVGVEILRDRRHRPPLQQLDAQPSAAFEVLLDRLARLASREHHARLLADEAGKPGRFGELLRDFEAASDHFKLSEAPRRAAYLRRRLGSDGFQVLSTLEGLVQANRDLEFDLEAGPETLALDPAWREIRGRAATILDLVGFDLGAWEGEQR